MEKKFFPPEYFPSVMPPKDYPLVSILMTCFNRQAFLAEAIKSVLQLRYSNFELIIVDDCSTDSTFEIARQYANRDRRIKVFRNDINLGDYPNRNRAAEYALGKYLKYVDSDDKILPGAICTMVQMMEDNPEAGLGLCSQWNEEGSNYPVMLDSRAAYQMHYFKHPIFFASPGLSIFRTETFRSLGGFPKNRMVSDFEMWHKTALETNILLLPSGLYWTRLHAGQEVVEQRYFVKEYETIKIKYLFGVGSPLTRNDAERIISERKRNLLKIALRKIASFQWQGAMIRLNIYFFYRQHFQKLKLFFSHNNHA